jgi:hypothetical protein
MYCGACGVTEALKRKSVYFAALLGVEVAEGPKHTVQLNVEWSR